jgi:hypothetical protein
MNDHNSIVPNGIARHSAGSDIRKVPRYEKLIAA